MPRYSYQTFPGQTLVFVRPEGFTLDELRAELEVNADGKILWGDESEPPEELRPLLA